MEGEALPEAVEALRRRLEGANLRDDSAARREYIRRDVLRIRESRCGISAREFEEEYARLEDASQRTQQFLDEGFAAASAMAQQLDPSPSEPSVPSPLGSGGPSPDGSDGSTNRMTLADRHDLIVQALPMPADAGTLQRTRGEALQLAREMEDCFALPNRRLAARIASEKLSEHPAKGVVSFIQRYPQVVMLMDCLAATDPDALEVVVMTFREFAATVEGSRIHQGLVDPARLSLPRGSSVATTAMNAFADVSAVIFRHVRPSPWTEFAAPPWLCCPPLFDAAFEAALVTDYSEVDLTSAVLDADPLYGKWLVLLAAYNWTVDRLGDAATAAARIAELAECGRRAIALHAKERPAAIFQAVFTSWQQVIDDCERGALQGLLKPSGNAPPSPAPSPPGTPPQTLSDDESVTTDAAESIACARSALKPHGTPDPSPHSFTFPTRSRAGCSQYPRAHGRRLGRRAEMVRGRADGRPNSYLQRRGDGGRDAQARPQAQGSARPFCTLSGHARPPSQMLWLHG